MVPFRTAVYADDLIMFVAPLHRDLLMVKTIFDVFDSASGLSCNMSKWQLVPIRCTEEQVQAVLWRVPVSACKLLDHLPGHASFSLQTAVFFVAANRGQDGGEVASLEGQAPPSQRASNAD
jgi:hypothetical protein